MPKERRALKFNSAQGEGAAGVQQYAADLSTMKNLKDSLKFSKAERKFQFPV